MEAFFIIRSRDYNRRLIERAAIVVVNRPANRAAVDAEDCLIVVFAVVCRVQHQPAVDFRDVDGGGEVLAELRVDVRDVVGAGDEAVAFDPAVLDVERVFAVLDVRYAELVPEGVGAERFGGVDVGLLEAAGDTFDHVADEKQIVACHFFVGKVDVFQILSPLDLLARTFSTLYV